ncbi:hypothetical protein MJO29_002618 [Puccinia striiformis f. sp. tritici]|nr:hypothetical protein MJO29_002618 [Puccinia striiformis f. sp. tritici]
MGAAAMAGYKSRLVDSLGPFLIIISCNFKSPQDLVSRLSSCICCGHIHLTATLKVQNLLPLVSRSDNIGYRPHSRFAVLSLACTRSSSSVKSPVINRNH